MKKLIAVLILLLCLCGCSNDKVNISDYNSILDKFLSKNTNLVNTYEVGYKYYLPEGVSVIDSENYNALLRSNGVDLYLYVDIASYYYKTDIEYSINNNAFYSNIIDYNGKKGYIEINKSEDLYNIVFYYNYAKIEAYADENNLGKTLINACYILNSIEFNDLVVGVDIGTEDGKFKEETFDFYTPKKSGNFIDYITLYDEYEEDVDNNIGNEES